MSERQDFHFLICKTRSGTDISAKVSGDKLAITELIVSDPFGEFYRFRIVEDETNPPLGWRLQNFAAGGNDVVRLGDDTTEKAQ